MKELIEWLKDIELLASEIYLEAALLYKGDSQLNKFFNHIAEDEAWHFHVMGSAADYLANKPDFTPAIAIDKETNDRIHNYLNHIQDGIKSKNISRIELIEKTVQLELSEWNDIFLYVVNFLKEQSTQFKYPAARIQAHIKEIEVFLEDCDECKQLVELISALPPVWTENILIVDDEELITELFKALLNKSGNIDITYNGEEAIKLVKEKYYKLIISDIDMPLKGGITFYKEVEKLFPSIGNRFLFVTGSLTPEKLNFFKENNVKYFTKPMDIGELRKVGEEIIMSK